MALTNQPITVQVQHDQVDTTSYELKVDGVVTETKPVDPAGINFQFPTGLAAGQYSITVTAVGPGGSTESDPVTLIVTQPVPAPAKPIIVIVVG